MNYTGAWGEEIAVDPLRWWRQRFPPTGHHITTLQAIEAVADMIRDAADLGLDYESRRALSEIGARCNDGLLACEARSTYGQARNIFLRALNEAGLADAGRFLVEPRKVYRTEASQERLAATLPIEITATEEEIAEAQAGFNLPGLKPNERFLAVLPLAVRLIEAGNGPAQVAMWLHAQRITPRRLAAGSVRMSVKALAPDVRARMREG
jgi:predicted DNA-binding transcriptional regulator YafY